MHSVLETPVFTRRADALLTRDERDALINHLAFDPEAGLVIHRLGGLRKMRWAPEGRGKRGAFRVIYYLWDETLPILAIFLFAKNEQADLTPAQEKAIAAVVRSYKENRR